MTDFRKYRTSGKFVRGHIHAAKLTSDQVMELRRLYAEEGWTQGRLSREFGLSVGQIGRIVRGESWQQYARVPHEQELEHEAAVAEPRPEAEIQESLTKLSQKLAGEAEPLDAMLSGQDPLGEWRRARSATQNTNEEPKSAPGEEDGQQSTKPEA